MSCLKNGITQRARLQVSRQPRRVVDPAVLDRYSVIRTFFQQLHNHRTDPRPRKSVGQPFVSRFHGNISQLDHAGFPSMVQANLHLQLRSMHSDVESNKTSGMAPQKSLPDPPEAPLKSEFSEPHPDQSPRNLENYPRFLRRLAVSLPHLHRPSRDDFLKVSSGFWQRALIRFRWLSIRSFRKFNADDISAFVTWFLMSQTLWIFVGT